MTGVSVETTELLPKRFELLSALVPQADVVGLLGNSNSPSHVDEVKILKPAVSARGKSLISVNAACVSGHRRVHDEKKDHRKKA
jgi:ABC-type uncharacterized transport system substrate-binding protein